MHAALCEGLASTKRCDRTHGDLVAVVDVLVAPQPRLGALRAAEQRLDPEQDQRCTGAAYIHQMSLGVRSCQPACLRHGRPPDHTAAAQPGRTQAAPLRWISRAG